MKKSRDYLVGIALGIGIALLAVIGYKYIVGLDPDAPANSEHAVAHVNTSQSTTNLETYGIDILSQIAAYSSDFERSARIYSVIREADEQELVDLLRRSALGDHKDTSISLQETVARKLASINPELALETLQDLPTTKTTSIVNGIFREWSHSDLEAAIASANILDNATKRVVAETILESRDDLQESTWLDIARYLGVETFALVKIANQEATSLVKENPKGAWDSIVNDELEDIYQLDALVSVFTEWVEREGWDALSRISARTYAHRNGSVLREIVSAVARTDPEAAYEYATSLPNDDQYYVVRGILSTWAESDPMTVLNILSKLDYSSSSDNLRRDVIGSWTKSNPMEIIDRIDYYPENLRQSIASGTVLAIAKNAPSEAVRILGSIENKVSNTSDIARTLAIRWSSRDPESALDWILSESQAENPQRSRMIAYAVRELVEVDLDRAFEVALDQPLRGYRGGLESEVIAELCFKGKIEEALGKLPLVREESKASSISSIGMAHVRTGETTRAMDLAEQLPESDKNRFHSVIASTWATEDPLDLFAELPRVPEALKSMMARELAQAHTFNPVLNDEQLETTKSYLNEEDAKHIELWESL